MANLILLALVGTFVFCLLGTFEEVKQYNMELDREIAEIEKNL